MAALRATAVILALLLGLMGSGLAQSPTPSPQPLPKDQFDALVEAVKKAVADELKAQGPTAAAKPEKTSPAGTSDARQPDRLSTFRQKLREVIAALPQANASAKRLSRALDESSTGGRGTWGRGPSRC